uniref:Uncharacterized protein n=1 Tax=Tetranychus urticae TaxID=32264 RepID=T1JRA8_TETUR
MSIMQELLEVELIISALEEICQPERRAINRFLDRVERMVQDLDDVEDDSDEIQTLLPHLQLRCLRYLPHHLYPHWLLLIRYCRLLEEPQGLKMYVMKSNKQQEWTLYYCKWSKAKLYS